MDKGPTIVTVNEKNPTFTDLTIITYAKWIAKIFYKQKLKSLSEEKRESLYKNCAVIWVLQVVLAGFIIYVLATERVILPYPM